MLVEERQRRILELLQEKPDVAVRELAGLLYVSEPTIRRDLTELHRKGCITKVYGGAVLNQGAADGEIPFLLREKEQSGVKDGICARAAEYVRDGMVVMLDGSTSAYHMVPYLARRKDVIAITSGAKTAVALAEANVRTFCTGGQMLIHSFSFVGRQAEDFVRSVNADVLFFSCHGLTEDGRMTDRAIEEANLRMAMFRCASKRVLLCDGSKLGKTCFYNMGTVRDIDAVISDVPLPPAVAEMLGDRQ